MCIEIKIRRIKIIEMYVCCPDWSTRPQSPGPPHKDYGNVLNSSQIFLIVTVALKNSLME